MGKPLPDLLFRCCSSTSVARLESGKNLLYADEKPLRSAELLLEFDLHSRPWQTTPTALVSTTTNFLRVIHLAFDKLSDGEDADSIEIIMIMPASKTGLRQLHHAKGLVEQLGWPKKDTKEYEYEYVFERRIPEDTVVHRITLGTLVRRGLTLPRLCGYTAFNEFPKMLEFQRLIRWHWGRLRLFDRGYEAAAAACLFGFHNLTGHMVEEMLGLTSYYKPYGPVKPVGPVKEGIEVALDSYASSLGDGLFLYKADLADLGEDIAILHHEFVIEAEEIMLEYCDEARTAQCQLAALDKEYCSNRAALERRLYDVYLQIGY